MSQKPSPVTSAEMRALDDRAAAEYKIPTLILMENAGRSVAEEIMKLKGRKVTFICGRGNNGGDGFVAARHVHSWGKDVRVTLIGSRELLTKDPAVNFAILERLGIPIYLYDRPEPVDAYVGDWAWPDSDILVDALFGTGLSKPLGEPYLSAVHAINKLKKSRKTVVSIDVPSGLNADTGEVMGAAVEASLTVTLAREKTGLRQGAGPKHTGKIVTAYISMPSALLS